MAYIPDENDLGSLWMKTSKNGLEFMSGTISGVEVVCFRVTKPTEKGPAWRVKKSRPREDQPNQAPMPPRPPQRASPPEQYERRDEFEFGDERRHEDDDF